MPPPSRVFKLPYGSEGLRSKLQKHQLYPHPHILLFRLRPPALRLSNFCCHIICLFPFRWFPSGGLCRFVARAMLEAPMALVVSLSARSIATMENAWNPTFVNASLDMVGALAQNVSQCFTFLGYVQLAVGSLFSWKSWSKALLLKILVILDFSLVIAQHLRLKPFQSCFLSWLNLVKIPILKINFVYLLLSTFLTSPEI